MISAQCNNDGSYELINGHMRLKAQLLAIGHAEVLDINTGKPVYVHEVEGRLVALSEDAQANLEDAANAAVNRARK